MSNTQDLANKIARLLEAEKANGELSSIRDALDRINERLERLESAPVPGPPAVKVLSLHPSIDRFPIAEAVTGEAPANSQNEKACTFEPNGRPCDHCSMCSSRGF